MNNMEKHLELFAKLAICPVEAVTQSDRGVYLAPGGWQMGQAHRHSQVAAVIKSLGPIQRIDRNWADLKGVFRWEDTRGAVAYLLPGHWIASQSAATESPRKD